MNISREEQTLAEQRIRSKLKGQKEVVRTIHALEDVAAEGVSVEDVAVEYEAAHAALLEAAARRRAVATVLLNRGLTHRDVGAQVGAQHGTVSYW